MRIALKRYGGVWNCRGSALLLGIFAVGVMMLLGAGLIKLVIAETNIAGSYRDGVAAQYAAEAGANRALLELNRNPAWPGAKAFLPLDPDEPSAGEYVAEVAAKSGGRCIIAAKGRSGQALRQVTVEVSLPQDGTGPPIAPYDYVLFSAGAQSIGSRPQVVGAIGSPTSEIPAPAVGLPSAASDSPAFNRLDYQARGASFTGGTVLTDAVYYVPGDWLVDQPLSGNATIYVAGSANIKANLSGNFLIVAEGNITFAANNNKENSRTTAAKAVLVAQKNIFIEDNALLTGAAIAGGTLTTGTSASITYDAGIVNYFHLPNAKTPQPFRVNKWNFH